MAPDKVTLPCRTHTSLTRASRPAWSCRTHVEAASAGNILDKGLRVDLCCAHCATARFAWRLMHAGCPLMQGMCWQSGVRVR